MVRSLSQIQFRASWPFVRKVTGHRKIGPVVHEKHKWPGQQKEFPEISPKFLKNNHEALRRYSGVQPTGFNDPETGKYIHVPEMVPELVVPDLSNFELKPYVSYKTDVQIDQRLQIYEEKLAKHDGDEELAAIDIKESERWPPPKMDARTLFDLFYADKIRKAHENKK